MQPMQIKENQRKAQQIYVFLAMPNKLIGRMYMNEKSVFDVF